MCLFFENTKNTQKQENWHCKPLSFNSSSSLDHPMFGALMFIVSFVVLQSMTSHIVNVLPSFFDILQWFVPTFFDICCSFSHLRGVQFCDWNVTSQVWVGQLGHGGNLFQIITHIDTVVWLGKWHVESQFWHKIKWWQLYYTNNCTIEVRRSGKISKGSSNWSLTFNRFPIIASFIEEKDGDAVGDQNLDRSFDLQFWRWCSWWWWSHRELPRCDQRWKMKSLFSNLFLRKTSQPSWIDCWKQGKLSRQNISENCPLCMHRSWLSTWLSFFLTDCGKKKVEFFSNFQFLSCRLSWGWRWQVHSSSWAEKKKV